MNLPNFLSLFRLVALIGFVPFFLSGHYVWAGFCYCLGGLSDVLDGYFARRLNQVTKVGQVLDPLVDKISLAVVLVCLWYRSIIPRWMLVILIGREVIMIAVAAYAFLRKDMVTPANIFGKAATLSFFIAVIASLFHQWIAPWHTVLMGISLILSVVAFVQYGLLYLKRRKTQNQA